MAYYHLFWDSKKQKPYIVKSGFKFFAFLFGCFYFVYYRAWISFAAFLLANITVLALQSLFPEQEFLPMIMSLLLSTYIGFDASDCLFGEYFKKGYRYLKSDFYASKEQAILAIFKINNTNPIIPV
jgi:hypothetical protein